MGMGEMMLIGKESFCDFTTIQEAVDFSEKCLDLETPITLHILECVYQEQVTISRSHITMIGIGNVVITNNLSATMKNLLGEEIGTFATATVYLDGVDIHLENITIENTAGPGELVGQAIALYANCDQSTFKYCKFKGYQDTLFTSNLPEKQRDGTKFPGNRRQHIEYRQYYQYCYIEGTVDYIFGGATAYFDQCILMNLYRDQGKPIYITAANTPTQQSYGFIFNRCIVLTENQDVKIYLGRPWRPFAKVIYQNCWMPSNIHPERWHDWNQYSNRKTVRFQEIKTNQVGFNKEITLNWGNNDENDNLKLIRLMDVFTEKFYV